MSFVEQLKRQAELLDDRLQFAVDGKIWDRTEPSPQPIFAGAFLYRPRHSASCTRRVSAGNGFVGRPRRPTWRQEGVVGGADNGGAFLLGQKK